MRRRFQIACGLLGCLLFAAANARTPHGAPGAGSPFIGACPVTSGPITLAVTSPRTTGISPLLVFFDATGTTDSTITGNTTVFQDVTFTSNFGDTGASGTGTWAFGSNPNGNSKNTATGAIAAHLYMTSGADQPYTATVTAKDAAGNTAQCNVAVTAYDPGGSNGWPSTATTCYFNSTVGSGCPSGATQTTASTFAAANGSLSNKRQLYKCGDTFTGDNETITGVKWQVGAYGGCEGTQTGNPIFSDTAGTHDAALYVGYSATSTGSQAGDGRISDILFNGNGTGGGGVNSSAFTNQAIPYQITLWNLQVTGSSATFGAYQVAQWGLIGSFALDATNISVFFNNLGNNSTGFAGTFPNLNYLAEIGNFVNGVGAAGGSNGIEAVRTSSCNLCLYENNTIQNASNGGGVFKFNSSNTYQSCGTAQISISGCWPVGTSGGTGSPCAVGAVFAAASCWTGYISGNTEISDNLFTGNSSAILSDIAPENGGADERLKNIVIERNAFNSPTNVCCEGLLFVTGANITFRDNGFYMPANGSTYPVAGAVVGQRGTNNLLVTQYIEAYNNTCFAPNSKGSNGVPGSGQLCIEFGTVPFTTAATVNSVCMNNLFYEPTTVTGPACHATGSGNTLSNNTVTVTNNPAFTNGGGSFLLISDFKPTANYSGGVSVPVLYDAILSPTNPYGAPWSPTWDLGAVHH